MRSPRCCSWAGSVWPGVAIGAFIANATTDAPIAVAWFTAAGNPLEALVAASLLQRVSDFDSSLERTRDVLALTILGAIVAPTVGATIGVAGLVLTGTVAASATAGAWFTWWGGDAMGILLVTPLILAWVRRPGRVTSTARILEGTALVAMTGIAGFLVFGGLLPGRVTAPLVYVALPLLIWAAFSFELRGAATGSAVIAALAVWWTSRGAGPFARETLGLSLVHLGAFMGVATLTSLVLAAIVRERRRADSDRAASLVRERTARRDAEFASSAKSDFLAVMSHELRTPLNAIIGYASLLADGITGPLNEQQVAQLGRVKGSATHLLALIEQILSLSRIEAGHEDMRVEHVDARTVVRDATTLVEPLMAAKGLALHVHLPPEPSELATDVTKVRQILLNLLTNAGKFTERGSVRCRAPCGGRDVRRRRARYGARDHERGPSARLRELLAGRCGRPRAARKASDWGSALAGDSLSSLVARSRSRACRAREARSACDFRGAHLTTTALTVAHGRSRHERPAARRVP